MAIFLLLRLFYTGYIIYHLKIVSFSILLTNYLKEKSIMVYVNELIENIVILSQNIKIEELWKY